jgi:hypothetical protein
LRNKGVQKNLVAASGLTPEEFQTVQKMVARLRDNLIEHAKDASGA